MKLNGSNPFFPASEDNPSYELYSAIDWPNTLIGTVKEWSEIFSVNLRNLLHSNIPMAMFWGEDLLFFFNATWTHLFRINQDKYLAQPAKLAYLENWPVLLPEFMKVINEQQSISVNNLLNLTATNKSEPSPDLVFQLNPLFLADGTVGGISCCAIEHTSQNQIIHQEGLQLSEAITIIENMVEGVILADKDGNILYENPAALSFLGHETFDETQLSKTEFDQIWDIFDLAGEEVPLNHWPLSRVLQGDEFSNLELELKHKRNKIRFIGSFAGRSVKDHLGRPILAILTLRDITGQKNAERDLINERLLLQTIYDQIPVILSIYDPHLETITLSKQLELVTGWTKEDTEKTNVMNLVYPDPDYRQYVADYMMSLQPGFKDIIMVSKDGKEINTSWANIKIPDGRQIGIGIDISERTQNEKKLQQYSERLQFLLEIDEAILSAHSEQEIAQIVVDRTPNMITGCAHASITLINFSDDEFSLLATSDIHYIEKNEVFPMPDLGKWEKIQKYFLTGRRLKIESLELLPIPVSLQDHLRELGIKTFIHHPIIVNNELIGTLNLGMKEVSLDPAQKEIIRELLIPLSIGMEHERLHEKALDRNRRLLETIINNIPAAISLIRGGDFKVLFANPTYYAISPSGHLVGKTLDQIWQDKKTNFGDLCAKVLETQKPYYHADDDFMISRKLGEPPERVFFSWWLFPVEIPDEDQMGILNMAFETTERKQAEQALIDAERLTTIGRMSASLAHEINNPIQSVVGCLGLAMENIESGEDPTELMDVAMDELVRASRIVQRMRDLGKQQQVEKEPTDIHQLMEKVLILTRKQAQNQEITILFEPAVDLPMISMISDQIHQVFLNIILNAIDAMPDGGTLQIKIEPTANPVGVRILFSDTGKGIPLTELENLFNAFHSTKRSGLGLGLYVSKSIVNDHGGEMTVDSVVDVGTTFTIWLPDGVMP